MCWRGEGVGARGLVGCIARLGLILWWSFWLLVLEGIGEVELFDGWKKPGDACGWAVECISGQVPLSEVLVCDD